MDVRLPTGLLATPMLSPSAEGAFRSALRSCSSLQTRLEMGFASVEKVSGDSSSFSGRIAQHQMDSGRKRGSGLPKLNEAREFRLDLTPYRRA